MLALWITTSLWGSEAPKAPDQGTRKETEKFFKDLRAALAAGPTTKEAAEDLLALQDSSLKADTEQLAEILATAEKIAEEQAIEAAGKPKLLAYAGKKQDALNKLELIVKAFARFPAATKALAAAKDEIENDKPGILLGEYWHGAALGATRYIGKGGDNPMEWFKPGPEKIAKLTGLPYVTFVGSDVLGNSDDENGILNYPDGTARARFMLWPGGDPGACMNELENRKGADRVKSAFNTGMNYMGICSGAFMVSKRCISMWPGQLSRKEPIIKGPPHDIVMPPYHPLSRMLKADTLKEVVFTGGANEMTLAVPDTEYIGFFRNGKYEGMEGNPALIAYYPHGWSAGRFVICPAHPEATKPEFLVMMCDYSMRHRYALPRNVITTDKPIEAVVGDHQCHYYEFLIGEGVKRIEAKLTGLTGACELTLKHGEPPRPATPYQTKVAPKPEPRGKRPDVKSTVGSAKPGRYFVLVYGSHNILNGANYTLQITTETETAK